jgi:hypothetical protein
MARQQYIKAASHQSGKSSKRQVIKAASHQSDKSSKHQVTKAASHRIYIKVDNSFNT